LLTVSFLSLLPALANANGAFPASQNVLAPATRPHEIILGTNFGLFFSEDDGQTWTWFCEQLASSLGYLYQLGPEPTHRLFGLAAGHLIYSDDASCSWTVAGGMLSRPDGGVDIEDYFPDPTDATHVLAAVELNDGTSEVVSSSDAGNTFASVIYQAAPDYTVTGIEVSSIDPMTIYAVVSGAPALSPGLARSVDGGVHWQTLDLGASLPSGWLRLIGIDPTDSRRVFLLWHHEGVDSLVFRRRSRRRR
jgi:hypothetical protein